jgi:hypothetical protein
VVRTFLFLTLAAAALTTVSVALASPAVGNSHARQAAPLAQAKEAGRKQPVVPGFYEGKTVRYFNFGPIKLKPGNKVAPIWTFTNGATGQRNIIDTVPGEKSYTPLWQVNKLTWKPGATPRVLRSADAVKKAVAAGQVAIVKTTTIVNCPVLGFGQKRVPGFSGGHVIHYYDLGPVKVAPGNAVLPLYTVTNGVAGQHNVTQDTVAPGQTAYPPLWAIIKAAWKRGTTARLLTSYAQIKKAVAAGQLTLQKTNLVVNCPLV